jgi:hypothetical protein
MEFFKTIVLTKNTRIVLWSVAGVLLAFLIFHAGLVAGSYRGMRHRGHGVVGIIATVALPTLTITEPNGDTETVFLATTTRVESTSSGVGTSTSALVARKRVIIFGDPDEARERINAKVIHILP